MYSIWKLELLGFKPVPIDSEIEKKMKNHKKWKNAGRVYFGRLGIYFILYSESESTLKNAYLNARSK